jgi:hypothetical protein
MRQELFFYFHKASWQDFSDGKVVVRSDLISYRDDEMMPLGSIELDIPEPTPPTEADFIQFQIRMLQKKKQEVLVEVEEKTQKIEARIRELSAITYKPAEEA